MSHFGQTKETSETPNTTIRRRKIPKRWRIKIIHSDKQNVIYWDEHQDNELLQIKRLWIQERKLEEDLFEFERCGLISLERGDNTYTIFFDVGKLIELEEANFVTSEISTKPSITNYVTISGGKFEGVNFAIGSLHQVSQQANTNSDISEQNKLLLLKLIDELTTALKEVPYEYQDDVETIAISASRLVEDINSGKPSRVKVTASGLIAATQNLTGLGIGAVAIAADLAQLAQVIAQAM